MANKPEREGMSDRECLTGYLRNVTGETINVLRGLGNLHMARNINEENSGQILLRELQTLHDKDGFVDAEGLEGLYRMRKLRWPCGPSNIR